MLQFSGKKQKRSCGLFLHRITSPNVHSPLLNSTTTNSNPISFKDNSPTVGLEVRRKPNMNTIHLNLVTHDSPKKRSSHPKHNNGNLLYDPCSVSAISLVWRMEGLPFKENGVTQSKWLNPRTLSSRTTATPEAEEAHIERQRALSKLSLIKLWLNYATYRRKTNF